MTVEKRVPPTGGSPDELVAENRRLKAELALKKLESENRRLKDQIEYHEAVAAGRPPHRWAAD